MFRVRTPFFGVGYVIALWVGLDTGYSLVGLGCVWVEWLQVPLYMYPKTHIARARHQTYFDPDFLLH